MAEQVRETMMKKYKCILGDRIGFVFPIVFFFRFLALSLHLTHFLPLLCIFIYIFFSFHSKKKRIIQQHNSMQNTMDAEMKYALHI